MGIVKSLYFNFVKDSNYACFTDGQLKFCFNSFYLSFCWQEISEQNLLITWVTS